ncbi:hypothetical protein C475_13747 [Halosimplex carlsbadense 2-9-1]|uniref:DUF4349 domain-containing protein n=1 Tax=Halosimplex carlsbadense 2-9-1 TaxID=797114 RepID=M0CPJ2_9EURY|nr:DUF4349 domain-containing protein [Halosimplex carlsbadense]ELZ24317.1 hypothetical protein C475_13747 [Halosimplex carlsbadense 2-9-1]
MGRKAAVLVVVLVALAGCASMGSGDSANREGADLQANGGDGGGSDGGDGSAGASGGDGGSGGSDAGDAEFSASDGDDGRPNAAAQVDRALIKTGTVTVEVENYSVAERAVRTRAAALGGYVSGSNVRLHHRENETWRTGYVEVRVPSTNFTALYEATQGQGTVLSADSNTKDVTDQLVDLTARLENLRAQRDRLRSLYDSANTTEDLLDVGEQLSNVQGEIERLEAQKRSLRDRVSFSTVRVELREPEPDAVAPEGPTPFHEQSPAAVFASSVGGFVTFARTVFVAGVAAVPWVVGLGVPALLVVGAGRRVGIKRRLPFVGGRSRSRRPSDGRDGADGGLRTEFETDDEGTADESSEEPEAGGGEGADGSSDE